MSMPCFDFRKRPKWLVDWEKNNLVKDKTNFE